jgi:hypothetical protein
MRLPSSLYRGAFSNSRIKAVLLKFYDSHIITAHDGDFASDAFASMLESTNEMIKLSGKSSTVSKFEEKLGERLAPKKVQFFCRMCCSNASSNSRRREQNYGLALHQKGIQTK